MQKVTLTGIWRNTTDKQGQPLKSAKGFPYTKLSFKCKEHGDKYIGGFGNKDNEGWKVGDTVEVIIKENGQYLNFDMPKEVDVATERIAKLESRVMKLELAESRMTEEIYSKVKSDLVLELTGKFNTTADYKKITAPHPQFADVPEPIPAEAYNNEPPF